MNETKIQNSLVKFVTQRSPWGMKAEVKSGVISILVILSYRFVNINSIFLFVVSLESQPTNRQINLRKKKISYTKPNMITFEHDNLQRSRH